MQTFIACKELMVGEREAINTGKACGSSKAMHTFIACGKEVREQEAVNTANATMQVCKQVCQLRFAYSPTTHRVRWWHDTIEALRWS